MICSDRRGGLRGLVLAAALVPAVAVAAERIPKKQKAPQETIEIFAGIESRQLDVKLIPRDSTRCRLLVANKTDRPLTVQLPGAFAGVPVAAQIGAPWPDPAPNQNRGQQTQPLGFGPGPNMVGPQLNPMFNLRGRQQQMPNPFQPGWQFNIPPEKVFTWRVTSVCLEHGKPDPRPRLPYEIKPIDQYTEKEGVADVCAMLGRGEVSQRIAQLAAWHLNNDMSWEELAQEKKRFAFGKMPAYTARELRSGKQVAEQALAEVEQRNEKKRSNSKTASFSAD